MSSAKMPTKFIGGAKHKNNSRPTSAIFQELAYFYQSFTDDMIDRFFNCVSIVLHPIFLTTLGMIVIIGLTMPGAVSTQLMLLGFSVGYTIALPMIFIGFARIIGYVSSLRMMERRERIFALTVAAVCAFAFQHILNNWHAPAVMRMYVMGSAVMLTMAAIITHFSRVSLHTIGWGGMTALVSYLSYLQPGMSGLLAASVLLSGLAATARLKLNEHTSWQIYIGFVLGFAVIWITFIISSL